MKRTIITAVVAIVATLAAQAQTAIEIVYSGTTATVTIPDAIEGITSSVNGANVTILSTNTATEYTYRVKGQSADGSLLISGSYKLQLQLDGLTLTNAHGGAAIDVECGKRIAVELMAGTVNTLADTPGSQKAALYFKGHAEFEGSGTLNVTGRAKHAICAKEYIELKSSLGTINVLGAVSDGIHCGKAKVGDKNNYFLMKGGVVSIFNVGSDGIDSDDYGVVAIEGGALSVSVGDDATALKADSTVTISGGRLSIAVTGADSEGIRARHTVSIAGGQTTILVTGNGSKGIKAKRLTAADTGATVLNGGFLSVSGGETTIHTLGGNFLDTANGDTEKCMGVSVDADMRMTNGTLTLLVTGPEAYAYNVKGTESRTGGQLSVVRTPWAVNARDYRYDMTAYVVVSRNGSLISDYANLALGAFIGSECVGYGQFDTAAYGTVRLHSNSTTASPVRFRLYDYATATTYRLSPSQTVTFQPDGCVGQPGSPLVLECQPPVAGDANCDGEVNVTDVTTVINHILGKPSADLDMHAADANGDGAVNITDVTTIINLILGK